MITMKEYKQLEKLAVPVHQYKDQFHYVLNDELNECLTEDEIKLFAKYFGIQTCAIVQDEDGTDNVAMYASDVEAALCRVFTGKLTGTQLFWD